METTEKNEIKKESKRKKRTLMLSDRVLERLEELSKYFHIDNSTYIRMAIYHGIEKINRGYCPYRNHFLRHCDRKKYPIVLPEETWDALKNVKETLQDNWYKRDGKDFWENQYEPIPDGELVELFINIEIKGHRELVNYVFENDLETALETKYAIKLKVDVPEILYDKFEKKKKATGITAEKFGRYLFLNSLMEEFYGNKLETIDSDADLIRFIDACGLNRYKAMILLKNLIAARKIILLNDEKEAPEE